MPIQPDSHLITDFLGSAHIFAFAVEEVIEEQLWREAAGDQFSAQQLKLLRLVSLSGSHTVSDIAALLGISNAAASKAVDKLARLMLLRRSEREDDRRAIHLSLTGAGRRVLEAYESALRRKMSEVLAQYSEIELRQVIETLDRLSAQIVGHHAHPDDLCVQCGVYFTDKCLMRQRLNRRCLYTRQRERSRSRSSSRERPESPGTPA